MTSSAAAHSRQNRFTLSVLTTLLCLLLAFAGGCGEGMASAPTTLEGAWLGEGKLQASRGHADVKAQLELLSDGSYRYLVIEPPIAAALSGPESGRWSRDGQTLTLTPTPRKPAAAAGGGGSVVGMLRDQQAREPKPPRTMTIGPNLADLQFTDGPLTLRFTPNPEATRKLQAAGEVGGT